MPGRTAKSFLFVGNQANANITDVDTQMAFKGVTLSDDGTTLTWELTAMEANLAGTTPGQGFNLTISGIRANAASLGDGQDVTATCSCCRGVSCQHLGAGQTCGREKRAGHSGRSGNR